MIAPRRAAAPDRFPSRLLAGEGRCGGPARGISFLDPGVLATAGTSPASALAALCERHSLDLAFVPADAPWVDEAAGLLSSDGVVPCLVVPGVLWPSLESLGVAAGLRAAAHDPSVLRRAMDAALRTASAMAQRALESHGGAIVVADDMSGTSGTLLSPGFLVGEVLPRLADLVALGRDAGVPSILHCDGDVRTLLPAARAAGFAAVHGDFGGQRLLAANLAAARAAGIVLVGGIPTAALAAVDTARAAGRAAAELARGGGLVIADDGGITTVAELGALEAAFGAASGA